MITIGDQQLFHFREVIMRAFPGLELPDDQVYTYLMGIQGLGNLGNMEIQKVYDLDRAPSKITQGFEDLEKITPEMLLDEKNLFSLWYTGQLQYHLEWVERAADGSPTPLEAYDENGDLTPDYVQKLVSAGIGPEKYLRQNHQETLDLDNAAVVF